MISSLVFASPALDVPMLLVLLTGHPVRAGTTQKARPAARQTATAASAASPTRGACLCATRCPARPAQARPPLHLPLGSRLAAMTVHVTSAPGASVVAMQRSSQLDLAADGRSGGQTAHAAAANCTLTGRGTKRAPRPRRASSRRRMETAAAPLTPLAPATCRTKRFATCLPS